MKQVDSMQVTQNNNEKKAVLFVDDEKMVLEAGSLMLQKLGYSVLTACKGQEAIEILKKNKVAIVLLDMQMPGMNGYETYYQLKKIQPKVKILLASGYVGDQSEKRLNSIGFDGFIQKPFDSKQLSEKIEDILVN
jgi:two-component system cell cycle sensor histidine kinase/response regulator CckA